MRKKLKRAAEIQAIEEGWADPKAARQLAPEVMVDPTAAYQELLAKGDAAFPQVQMQEAPALETLEGDAYDKGVLLCHAIYRAIEQAGGSASMQQVRCNMGVKELMDDPAHRNQRFHGLVTRHAGIFTIDEDNSVSNNWRVAIVPNARKNLPDLEKFEQGSNELNFTLVGLPEKIAAPQNGRQQVEALRIEFVHSLSARNSQAYLQDLGQDPDILARKGVLGQGTSLQEFLRSYPQNFQTESLGEGNIMVQLLDSTCVPDGVVADDILRRSKKGKGKGKGKEGKGKGGGFGKGMMGGMGDMGGMEGMGGMGGMGCMDGMGGMGRMGGMGGMMGCKGGKMGMMQQKRMMWMMNQMMMIENEMEQMWGMDGDDVS